MSNNSASGQRPTKHVRAMTALPVMAAIALDTSKPITVSRINKLFGLRISRMSFSRYMSALERTEIIQGLKNKRKWSIPFEDRYTVDYTKLAGFDSEIKAYLGRKPISPVFIRNVATLPDSEIVKNRVKLERAGEATFKFSDLSPAERLAQETLNFYDLLCEYRLVTSGIYKPHTSYRRESHPETAKWWDTFLTLAEFHLEIGNVLEFDWRAFLKGQFGRFNIKACKKNWDRVYPLPYVFMTDAGLDCYEKYAKEFNGRCHQMQEMTWEESQKRTLEGLAYRTFQLLQLHPQAEIEDLLITAYDNPVCRMPSTALLAAPSLWFIADTRKFISHQTWNWEGLKKWYSGLGMRQVFMKNAAITVISETIDKYRLELKFVGVDSEQVKSKFKELINRDGESPQLTTEERNKRRVLREQITRPAKRDMETGKILPSLTTQTFGPSDGYL